MVRLLFLPDVQFSTARPRRGLILTPHLFTLSTLQYTTHHDVYQQVRYCVTTVSMLCQVCKDALEGVWNPNNRLMTFEHFLHQGGSLLLPTTGTQDQDRYIERQMLTLVISLFYT